MKNNILLITAVTIIAVGIIAAVIVLSATKTDKKDNGSSSSSGTSAVVQTDPESEVPQPEESSAPPVTTTEPVITTSAPVVTDEPVFTAPEAEGIVATAKSLIGVPFVDDGDTPEGFDNSGFIYYVLRENGYITCPRGVGAQASMGTALSYDELKAGDLVFFCNESGNGAGFGGIYIGNGKMISCLMPGTAVKEVDISTEYYTNNFYRGVSLS